MPTTLSFARNSSSQVDDLKAEIAALQDLLQETQTSLDEFQAESRELEAELEKELERANKRANDLELKCRKAESESDTLRERLVLAQHESLSLQKSVEDAKQKIEAQARYIQQLEQQNDDLQRSERMAASSHADAESKLNAALERIVMLEAEVEERETLKEEVQRQKDEMRDMRLELELLKSKQAVSSSSSSSSSDSSDSQPLGATLQRDAGILTELGLSETFLTSISASGHAESQIDLVNSLLERMMNVQTRIQHCRKQSETSAGPETTANGV